MRLTFIICLLTFGCSIEGSGIYFKEMDIKPSVTLDKSTLLLNVTRSARDSTLVLETIHVSVDNVNKEVFISGEQGVGGKFHSSYLLNIKDYDIRDATEYKYYWVYPPTKEMTRLKVSPIVF